MPAKKPNPQRDDRLIFCKGCGEQMTVHYEYCDRCAEKLQGYDFARDDLNYDAEREKGR